MDILKHVDDTQESTYILVDSIEPLTFAELRTCLKGGKRVHRTTVFGCISDEAGTPSDRFIKTTADITFHEPAPFHALVPNGVLPLTYVRSGTVLALDRSSLAALTRRADSNHSDAQSVEWFKQFLNQSISINPLPAILEGNQRRTLSFEDTLEELTHATEKLRSRLPNATVSILPTEHLRRLHAWRVSLDEEAERETKFLCAIAPLLADRVPTHRLEQIGRKIRESARNDGIGNSLAVLTALAVLYESETDEDGGSARGVLHPKKHYSRGDAYNAISDLRQLTLTAASSLLPGSIALLTGDRALALLWCGLRPTAKTVAGRINVYLSPVQEFFPRLPPAARSALFAPRKDS